ncbi:MAG: cation:proton antiporter [Desulfarculus sp.]|nr:cation:proton antiporter [Desulfarculus sp.]
MHHVLASIEFQMSLLLFVSLGGYLLASRIGQPAVVGIILMGLAIGPSGLGLVTYSEFVKSIAHLGAIVLLFVVGLEFEIKDLTNSKYVLIGVAGVLVPLAGGYWVAQWFGHQGQSAWLIGVALTATSIAITADALREMGRLQTAAAKAIIGAAVADDVLALMALGMVRQMAAGDLSLGRSAWLLVQALAFVGLGAWLGLRLMAPLAARLDRTDLAGRYPEVTFIFAMMLAFFYALLAEMLGLSAIVGSFLAGVALSQIKPGHGKGFREGAEYLRVIFASVFFVSLGVLTDLQALTWTVVWFLLALTAVGTLTKVLGCGLPALSLGLGSREALAVGVGMVPRGEVAMIVALIGLDNRVIGQPVYLAIVAMSLLTTIFPPLVLKNWIYHRQG